MAYKRRDSLLFPAMSLLTVWWFLAIAYSASLDRDIKLIQETWAISVTEECKASGQTSVIVRDLNFKPVKVICTKKNSIYEFKHIQ